MEIEPKGELAKVRILQRNTLYVIGISPQIAREEILRRYEYFGQYGRILSLTLNKDKGFQADQGLLCYSAYITYNSEKEASLGLLSVDQHVYDGRLMHASFGRTKYCRFFLKSSGCLNHGCPYLHKVADPQDILHGDQQDSKKALFQQCFQLALTLAKIFNMTEPEMRNHLRQHKEHMLSVCKIKDMPAKMFMPQPV